MESVCLTGWAVLSVTLVCCILLPCACDGQSRAPLERFSRAKEKIRLTLERHEHVLREMKLSRLADHVSLPSSSLDEWQVAVENCLKKLRSATLKIMVVGPVSHGKSSLVNALLGQNVLPSDAGPVLADVSRCQGNGK